MKRKKSANYPEVFVGIAIQSLLSSIVFENRVAFVELFSAHRERILGIDGLLGRNIVGIKPFWMQFKKPSAWPAECIDVAIIETRNAFALDSNPMALYFDLREKRNNQGDYQHNILRRLSLHAKHKQFGNAAYVCPLFLKLKDYQAQLTLSILASQARSGNFFHYGSISVIDSLSGKTNFESIPILNAHVSVQPHDYVISAKHKYSFNAAGSEVCFHSPMSIPEGSKKFSQFLNEIYYNQRTITFENAESEFAELIQFLQDEIPLPFEIASDSNGFSKWLELGYYLEKVFDIHQFALVTVGEENSQSLKRDLRNLF